MRRSQGTDALTRTQLPFPVVLIAACIALTVAAGSAAAATMPVEPYAPAARAVERVAAPVVAPPPAVAVPAAEALPVVPPPSAPSTPAVQPAKPSAKAAAPKPAPAKPAPAPPAPAPVPEPAPPPVAAGPAGPTSWPELNAAISRIAGYDGSVTWVVSNEYGQWGTADWYRDRIYIAPDVPHNRLDDVVVHEWSHLLSVRPYADVHAAVEAMNQWFGGSDLTGAELAADCMAILQGARWTRYTSCEDPRWQDGARRLLSGQRLA